ncbi:hypothetical protein [Streptomyces sp. NPDC018059]|uniref:hypothetical protein n=1 Tax=Streptomyces sp. NPDC018059 TaxID=3365041 RepID=UPI0037B1C3A6
MNTPSLQNVITAPLRVRRGDGRQKTSLLLSRDGDGFTVAYDPDRASLGITAVLARACLSCDGITVSEVILEGHDPELTALYRAASKLLVNIEITSSPRITEPVVKLDSDDPPQATYFISEGWCLSDALDRLPAAFATARPEVARNLLRIEQTKRDSDGQIDQALDVVAALILKTGNPTDVYDQLLDLLDKVRTERASDTATASAA